MLCTGEKLLDLPLVPPLECTICNLHAVDSTNPHLSCDYPASSLEVHDVVVIIIDRDITLLVIIMPVITILILVAITRFINSSCVWHSLAFR
jgi:hypothetical protein